jgi:4-hydroxythreonine-4-phosphate dehydrogenase
MYRALAARGARRNARMLLLGAPAVLERAREVTGARLAWRVAEAPVFPEAGRLVVHDPAPLAGRIPAFGRPGVRTGRASLGYVEAAIGLSLSGAADALVTGPIAKAAWAKAGADVPGHTELLARRSGGARPVMMLVGGGLRVALVTTHLALRDVPGAVTRAAVRESGRILGRELRAGWGIAAPRIAVLGLNPHAGEAGRFGDEEARAVRPAVRDLVRAGVDARGPLPADTAFHAARTGRYDAVLAMYHDQGLGPLKTVAFETGVNVTLGLPIVRTSVDHGTAFDIAGTGKADARSALEAIRLAVTLAGNRAGERA